MHIKNLSTNIISFIPFISINVYILTDLLEFEVSNQSNNKIKLR